MLSSIFSALFSSIIGIFTGWFGKSRDAENGALKVDNATAKQELENVQKTKFISDRVDGLRPDASDKLRTDLNNRD